MGSIVTFFNRTRHDPAANIVVDGGTCNNLFILQFGRQIIQIFAQQINGLLHIQTEIGYLIPFGKAKAHKMLFPPTELTRNQMALSYDIIFPPAVPFSERKLQKIIRHFAYCTF